VTSFICGTAFIEPTPFGEVACLCALATLGGIIVQSASNTTSTSKSRSSGFVAPGQGIQWPGDCDGDYLKHLQEQKDALCDVPRRCHKRGETCENVQAKMLAGYQCRDIRMKIMNECFRGGDEEHRQELETVEGTLAACGLIALKVCQ
jgi:hypothetical protein